jgi:hypothetical protein
MPSRKKIEEDEATTHRYASKVAACVAFLKLNTQHGAIFDENEATRSVLVDKVSCSGSVF